MESYQVRVVKIGEFRGDFIRTIARICFFRRCSNITLPPPSDSTRLCPRMVFLRNQQHYHSASQPARLTDTMASDSDKGGTRGDSNASSSSFTDLDRHDPPPPPTFKGCSPEERSLGKERAQAWIDRNTAYLRLSDSRGLQHLPLLSRLWGYDYQWYCAMIAAEVTSVTLLAGRRLNPEEMSVFTSHTARGAVAASYDRPIAIGATILALYRGWGSYRMPFYQPRFTTFVHPQASLRPFLSSLAWHSSRVGLYGLIGLATYKLLGERYRSYMMDRSVEDAVQVDPGMQGLVDSRKQLQDMIPSFSRKSACHVCGLPHFSSRSASSGCNF